jgi:hypothetical protein
VDALVSGCGKGGGFLDWIAQAFDWSAFEALPSPVHASSRRRFCGLPLEVDTPDHASIWRFRQTIDKLGLSAALLSETNRQLDALGLIAKRGTLVDATLIAPSGHKKPPSHPKKPQL